MNWCFLYNGISHIVINLVSFEVQRDCIITNNYQREVNVLLIALNKAIILTEFTVLIRCDYSLRPLTVSSVTIGQQFLSQMRHLKLYQVQHFSWDAAM